MNKMHRFVQKNLKLIKISKQNVFNKCFHHRPVYLRLSNYSSVLVSHNKKLATVVPKYNSTYNSENNKERCEAPRANQVAIEDIDKAILDIDYIVRRTGRILFSNVENVFAMVENIGFASAKQSLCLLRCCDMLRFESPVKRIDFANKMWNKFQSLGIQFDVKHYNALLKVYLSNNHEFSPSEMLISMESQEIEPNHVTYGYLIEKFCKDGNLSGANEILEHMKEKEIPVNEAIFISLIKGHVKINDISGAEEIIGVMRANDISSEINSQIALACGFAEKGNFDKVEEILLQAEKNGISLKDHHYFQIIMSLTSADYADTLLMKMQNIPEMQQEFLNSAMDLIHRNLDAIAYKLISSISSPENSSSINVFLKLLIKSNMPVERIVQYSNEIYEKGLSSYIFSNIAKVSLEYEKFDYSMSFFDEMHKRGIPVRLNHFWPIFMGYKNSPDAIWKTLRKMSDLGLMADFITYIEYIFPALSSIHHDVIISKIQDSMLGFLRAPSRMKLYVGTNDCGQSAKASIDPLFEYYCFSGKLDYATNLIEKCGPRISPFFKLERYLSLYDKFKQNPTTYFKILKYIMENTGFTGQNTAGLQGKNLAVLIQTDCDLFTAFHRDKSGKSCLYSEECLKVCRNIVRKESPNLLVYLHKLRNDILDKKSLSTISLEEEERMLNFTNGQNQPNPIQLLKLLSLYIKNRNIERFNQVKSELDSMGFVISPIIYAQMFSLYCEMNDIVGAKETLIKLKDLHPNFQLDSSKMFEYARLFLKLSKFDDALEVIKNECKEINYFGGPDLLIRNIRIFLDSVIQIGDIEFLKAVHTALIHQAKSLQLTNILLEPFIKFYLQKYDYENCLKEFRNCVINYSCTPCLNLLLRKLIIAGEEMKLQTVVDLAAKVEGKNKILHQLFFVFISLNHLSKARKIIQNLQGNIDFHYFEEMCKELFSQSKTVELETILRVTSGLKHKNREEIYYHLLKLYDHKNYWRKAEETLDLMAEESIEPSQKSKELINDLFQRNSQPVPFKNDLQNSQNAFTNKDSFTMDFFNFLNNKDAVQALKVLKIMKKGAVKALPLSDISRLVELLVEKDVLIDLSTNVSAMTYVIENSEEIFKPLLEKYSQDGNVEGIMALTSTFPDFTLKKSSYSTFLAKTFITSKRPEDLLLELENRWDKKNKLFSTYAFEELLKFTHLEERVIQLSRRYLEVNFDIPIAVVWAHYFTSENYAKADEIFQIHTIPIDKVDAKVFRIMRHFENVSMGRKYIEFLDQINPKSRSKERAYGTLLDLLVLKQLYDDAADLVITAQKKNIDLERHYNSTLMTLRNALERENKHVLFNISSETFHP